MKIRQLVWKLDFHIISNKDPYYLYLHIKDLEKNSSDIVMVYFHSNSAISRFTYFEVLETQSQFDQK